MLGSAQCPPWCLFSQSTCEGGVIVPILQMGLLRHYLAHPRSSSNQVLGLGFQLGGLLPEPEMLTTSCMVFYKDVLTLLTHFYKRH